MIDKTCAQSKDFCHIDELKTSIRETVELQNVLIKYVDRKAEKDFCYNEYFDNEEEAKYNHLMKFITENKILTKNYQIKTFLKMINQISLRHQKTLHSNEKLFKVMKALIFDKNALENIPKKTISQIFKENKLFLLFFIENNVLEISSLVSKYNVDLVSKNFFFFFFTEIEKNDKNLFEIYLKNNNIIIPKIEQEKKDLKSFETKRKFGHNETFVAELIRQDNIGGFMDYTTTNDIDLNTKINRSYFETNPTIYKMKNGISFVDYSASYGAVKIFKFLYLNKVEMSTVTMKCAIEGRNIEILNILETFLFFSINESQEYFEISENSENNENNEGRGENTSEIIYNVDHNFNNLEKNTGIINNNYFKNRNLVCNDLGNDNQINFSEEYDSDVNFEAAMANNKDNFDFHKDENDTSDGSSNFNIYPELDLKNYLEKFVVVGIKCFHTEIVEYFKKFENPEDENYANTIQKLLKETIKCGNIYLFQQISIKSSIYQLLENPDRIKQFHSMILLKASQEGIYELVVYVLSIDKSIINCHDEGYINFFVDKYENINKQYFFLFHAKYTHGFNFIILIKCQDLNFNETPLHSASRCGHIEIVTMLLNETTIDVNSKDHCFSYQKTK